MTHENTQNNEKLAFSIKEMSNLTGLSQGFLRNEILNRRLTISRFGRRVLILREDLEKYLRNRSN